MKNLLVQLLTGGNLEGILTNISTLPELKQEEKLQPAVTIVEECGNGVILNGPAVGFNLSPSDHMIREYNYYTENKEQLELAAKEHGIVNMMAAAYINGFSNGSQVMEEAIPDILQSLCTRVQEKAVDHVVVARRSL